MHAWSVVMLWLEGRMDSLIFVFNFFFILLFHLPKMPSAQALLRYSDLGTVMVVPRLASLSLSQGMAKGRIFRAESWGSGNARDGIGSA